MKVPSVLQTSENAAGLSMARHLPRRRSHARARPPCLALEIDEVVDIIAQGRTERRAVELPERLRTRDWASVLRVVLALDVRRGRRGVGWKIGAASQEIRTAEGLPALLRAGSTRGRCSLVARPWDLNCSSIIAT